MSSAGAAMQVHKHSTNEDIIEYLQQFEDYRLPVVIECFRDKDAWKQELTPRDKDKYFGYWSMMNVRAGNVDVIIPSIFEEEIRAGTIYRKIDVALLFLQEIAEEGQYNVDEVLKALRHIEETNGNRSQFANPHSFTPTVVQRQQSGHLNAEEQFGPLGDGPKKNNHVASRKPSSQRFEAPDTVTTSEDEGSYTNDEKQTHQSGSFNAVFSLRDKQLQLRFW